MQYISDNTKSILKKIGNLTVLPSSLIWKIIFPLLRLIYKINIKRVNTKINYIVTDDWLLILTPLAGSSSVSAAIHKSTIKTHDLRETFEKKIPSSTYILDRDFNARLTSFYNKKVRNPTSIAKANLLASCSPLRWTSSPIEFLEWERDHRRSLNKDKHLYTKDQILNSFGLDSFDVKTLSIKTDYEFINDLLGICLSEKVNSTEDVAIFSKPLALPFEQLSK